MRGVHLFTPKKKKHRTNLKIQIALCFSLMMIGADYGARTRHLDLGKVALYQMS